MSGRYYDAEHLAGYARIRQAGLSQWDNLHGSGAGLDDFPNRDFLARRLPVVGGRARPRVLEYGCGTGPAACFLAARGYAVDAVDLVPDAIAVARRHAAERGLFIRFEVQDVCRWGEPVARYDYVIDSFCLQSIVLDEDRRRLFESVRARLEPDGRYLISTAMFEPARDYGDDRFDPSTGMVWTPASGPGTDAMLLHGAWFLPHRRHLAPEQLRAELEEHGFEVIEQSRPLGGDVVCSPTHRGAS